jgi:GT2 family glycosyltransferase
VITAAIPTYNRGAILVETIERLLALDRPPDAILVADQTRKHEPAVASRLAAWEQSRTIRWMRLPEPSVPKAMNALLRNATTRLVLFLDDDIEPRPGLVSSHVAAHSDAAIWAVAGQVLQPGEEPVHYADPGSGLAFRFNHDERQRIRNVMAGNLSVNRERALSIGGFDENFVGAAYRFESDFAFRICEAGGAILYEPAASLRHLQLSSGGLRSYGDHRTSASPMHSVGDYYFALRHGMPFRPFVLRRLRQNVLTRFHARRPWTIPSKFIGEVRGLLLARKLYRKGPALQGIARS